MNERFSLEPLGYDRGAAQRDLGFCSEHAELQLAMCLQDF